jgi:putative Holliday junction resolvase
VGFGQLIFEDVAPFLDEVRPMQAIAGLDLGTVTLGVAVSDTFWSIATPLETIKRKKFGVDATAL